MVYILSGEAVVYIGRREQGSMVSLRAFIDACDVDGQSYLIEILAWWPGECGDGYRCSCWRRGRVR